MNAEYWIKYNLFAREFIDNYETHSERILSTGNTTEAFVGNLIRGLQGAHVFEVGDTIKKLLMMTDPPNKNDDIPLPFKYFFLDCKFTKEELAEIGVKIKPSAVIGVLVTEGQLILKHKDYIIQEVLDNGEPVVMGRGIRMTPFSLMPDGEGWFDTFNTNINLTENALDLNVTVLNNKTSDHNTKKFIHKFVINFLNFIHNPEVELIEHKRSEKSIARRKKEGKVPIQSSSTIKVNGTLKKYIDMVEGQGHMLNFGYRFWVRGHYRRLMSDRYKEKKIIFIPPFIKGKGILVEKFYSVKKKGNTEEK